MTRVVVDADYLVYSAGFAVGDEPLSHALHLVNKTLAGIEEAMTAYEVDYRRLELFLTGKDNFRDVLATIKGYKANRDPAHKPVHYKAIREYLVDKLGAETVHGIEADDAVAMVAAENPENVIVSVDKDLLTVPGTHYNFKTKVFRVVSEQEALVNFYRQLITGDPTDNIGGAYKAGKKKAEAIGPDSSESEMYHYALGLYKNGLGVNGCPYGNMAAEDALLENARLLHLKRHPDDEWVPPGLRGTSGQGSSGPSPPASPSPTSTKPSRSGSHSRPSVTDVVSAALVKLTESPPILLTSVLPVPDGSSKPKGSSRRRTGRSRSRSKSSTPTASTPSSSRETTT